MYADADEDQPETSGAQLQRNIPVPPRNKRVIGHISTFYGSRNPAPILAGVRRLIDSGRIRPDSVVVRLIGDIDSHIRAAHEDLFASLERSGALEVVGSMPRQAAIHELRTAESLLLIDISDRFGYAVPAKLFEYLRVGRPILVMTDQGSPVERVMQMSGIRHAIVHNGTPVDQIASRIESFLNLPVDIHESSAWFREQFDGREQTAILARVLESVIRK